MSEKVFLNGKIVDREDAKISVFDRGFLLGDGLFETMRAYRGKVFRVKDHLARLERGAKRMGIPLPALSQLESAIDQTIRANEKPEAVVRLTVSRGAGRLGIVPSKEYSLQTTIAIIVEELPAWSPEMYEQGVSVVVTADRRNQLSALTAVKTTNFAPNVLASMEARRAHAVEAVFLNTRGNVAEGATSNVFIVSGGYVVSPFEEDGLLSGVTRQVVIELCEELQLPFVRKNLTAPELWKAEECFLTGTTKEIMPVVRVDEHRVASGKPGPVTLKLLAAYRERVRVETRADS